MAEAKTIARPYAKAAFHTAHAGDSLENWAEALALLSSVSQQSKVQELISSPAVTASIKAEQLKALCEGELNNEQQNFLAILASNKRLELLPDIERLFDELKSERERSVNVVVNSPFPLDSEAEQKLAAMLKQKLQREVSVETAIDESLVGGVLIKAGDVVIDGSIKGRLAKLAEAMNS